MQPIERLRRAGHGTSNSRQIEDCIVTENDDICQVHSLQKVRKVQSYFSGGNMIFTRQAEIVIEASLEIKHKYILYLCAQIWAMNYHILSK